jgi:hypothetical protein
MGRLSSSLGDIQELCCRTGSALGRLFGCGYFGSGDTLSCYDGGSKWTETEFDGGSSGRRRRLLSDYWLETRQVQACRLSTRLLLWALGARLGY